MAIIHVLRTRNEAYGTKVKDMQYHERIYHERI
jgi:hypothetical protein